MFTTAVFCAAAIITTLIDRLLRVHAIHSLLWRCTQRTNTNHQTRFENLQRFYIPNRRAFRSHREVDVVTLDFAGGDDGDDDAMIIDIPVGSGWASPEVCHRTQTMCREIEISNGLWYVGTFVGGMPSPGPPERPRLFRSIGVPYGPSEGLTTAKLFGSPAARQADHVLASAIQDAELYFSLCSTPLWIRLVYFLTKKLSVSAAEVLAHRVLWIQIRSIFFHSDTWEYRGRCTIFRWYYIFLNPPEWVVDFEQWSQHFSSEQFLRANFWLGYVFFGMQPWYDEYELLPAKVLARNKL